MADTPKKPRVADFKPLKESVSTTHHRLGAKPDMRADPKEVRGSVSTTSHNINPKKK